MERWKLNSHCVYNLKLSNVFQFNDFINVQWLVYQTKTCYDLILHETQKDFLNGNTQSSFLSFLSYMGRKKIFPDSIKFYYLEEAEFTTEIIKILPPPWLCTQHERGNKKEKRMEKENMLTYLKCCLCCDSKVPCVSLDHLRHVSSHW